MFTGTDKQYREASRRALECAAQITELLNEIHQSGTGVVLLQGPNKINGPGFTIYRGPDRWSLNA